VLGGLSDAPPAASAVDPAHGWVDGALLSFVAAFVDTACFIGLFGLFTAHVTGNFVLIGAALVSGDAAILGKLLALPVFVVAVAATALWAGHLRATGRRPLPWLLLSQGVLLALAVTVVAVPLLPAPKGGNDPAALAIGLLAVAAMGLQNALMRLELGSLPPSTVMTGNVTQWVIDAVTRRSSASPTAGEGARVRRRQLLTGLIAFTAGAAAGALLYAWAGLSVLAVPMLLCFVLAWRTKGREAAPSKPS